MFSLNPGTLLWEGEKGPTEGIRFSSSILGILVKYRDREMGQDKVWRGDPEHALPGEEQVLKSCLRTSGETDILSLE